MLLCESDKFLTINMSFAIFSVTFRLWHSNFWSIWWQKFAENSWEKKTILPPSRTQQHTSAHQLQKLSTHKVNCLQNITLLKTHQEANFRRKSKLPASLAQPCQRARGGHIKIFYTPCSSKFLNPSGKILFFLLLFCIKFCGMVIVYQQCSIWQLTIKVKISKIFLKHALSSAICSSLVSSLVLQRPVWLCCVQFRSRTFLLRKQ